MPSIVVRNLKKFYGDFEALKGISFQVEEGEVFSLLGPNGAGKTTTVEIILGLRKKSGGEVVVLGSEKLTKDVKDRIGVVFQQDALLQNLTVEETLKMFRTVHIRGLSVDDVIEMVGLQEKRKVLVRKLSGGQRRRLSIAVAIVGDPDLLILDEPTTGLDPQSRRRIWEIVLWFKERGKTVLLTTHYMDEAERISDRVCIIDHGKIVEEGSPREIIERSGIESVVEVIVNGEKRVFSSHRPEEDVKRLLKEENVESVVIRKPNLEDVFIKLTGRRLRD